MILNIVCQQYSAFEAKPSLWKSLAFQTAYGKLLPMGTSHLDNHFNRNDRVYRLRLRPYPSSPLTTHIDHHHPLTTPHISTIINPRHTCRKTWCCWTQPTSLKPPHRQFRELNLRPCCTIVTTDKSDNLQKINWVSNGYILTMLELYCNHDRNS